MIQALYTRDDFKKQSEEFRIGAVISDGMWYSLPKWRKIARVSEETMEEWVSRHLANGMLLQSATGARSYRFPLESIHQWYEENDLDLNVQLIDFLFPPRIWDGMTETEGFLEAPLREIGIVSFTCSAPVAALITQRLKGIARVREAEPNRYKSYCLEASYVKSIVEEVFKNQEASEIGKIYSRTVTRRRELVDFTPEFSKGLVLFYKNFGRTLVKSSMDTINIFLPDREDQETQIVMWVIAAIEKFDESTSVPFSGYLNTVLKRWPYDLPNSHLGKELSDFQRQRARAIESLKQKTSRAEFATTEIAQEMEVDSSAFVSLEEKHKIWLASRNPATLTWTETSEEKVGANLHEGLHRGPVTISDIHLANRISLAVVQAALSTEAWDDALSIISQIDAHDINLARIKEVSEKFIQALGVEMGLGGEETTSDEASHG